VIKLKNKSAWVRLHRDIILREPLPIVAQRHPAYDEGPWFRMGRRVRVLLMERPWQEINA